MLRPGIPEKAIKSFSTRNKGTRKINQDLVEGKGVSSRASLLGPWVPNGMTLPASGYHTRVVALGGTAKRKGVSSRANLLISVKVFVGNIATSGHQAGQYPLTSFLKEKGNKKIKNNKDKTLLEDRGSHHEPTY
jgi:hypothetical protein